MIFGRRYSIVGQLTTGNQEFFDTMIFHMKLAADNILNSGAYQKDTKEDAKTIKDAIDKYIDQRNKENLICSG